MKVTDEEKAFDKRAYERAMELSGFKGYADELIMPMFSSHSWSSM